MRWLLDENQSPVIAELLCSAGHDAVHVRDLGRAGASDLELLVVAADEDRVIVSGDTDFGELLARTNRSRPSIVLLRRQAGRKAAQIASLLLANLPAVEDDLRAGAIVVVDEDRLRIRRLPLHPS